MKHNDKIYIAGHRGLVGSAILRELESRGFKNIICRSHKELDLTNQFEVQKFFKDNKPDFVILAAAKVGGIHANNTYPAEFIYDNLNDDTHEDFRLFDLIEINIFLMLIAASQGMWFWPVVGMLVFSTVFAFPFFLLGLEIWV